MATLGQYQSFALIAYDALRLQTQAINKQIGMGCEIGDCKLDLYWAKNVIDTVFNYSVGCCAVDGLIEEQIIKACDWLTKTIKFTTTPIPQLEETYLNTEFPDFNQEDFNKNDFA